MVKIVRHAAVGDVLCAARRTGADLMVYLPLDEISEAVANALSDVLTESLRPTG